MAVVVSCDANYLKRFGQEFVESVKRNTKQDRVYISVLTGEYLPWEAACERFYLAAQLDEPELIILDIDSLFIKDVQLPEGDVGLYFREENEDPRMKVAAGMVVVRDRKFLRSLCGKLKKQTGWYADQRALWDTYKSYECKYFDVSPYLTWEFDDKPIWTGKGALKRSETFQEKMDEFRA